MARNAKKMQKKLLGERKICVLLFMNLKHKMKKMKVKSFFAGLLLGATALAFSSCATIVSGTSAKITLEGDVPEPVTIKTDYQTYPNVNLPAVVRVKRQHIEDKHISITSENYTFRDIVLQKTVNEWAFGNIVIGGLVGFGVDLVTNCVSKPEQSTFFIHGEEKQKTE